MSARSVPCALDVVLRKPTLRGEQVTGAPKKRGGADWARSKPAPKKERKARLILTPYPPVLICRPPLRPHARGASSRTQRPVVARPSPPSGRAEGHPSA